MLKPIKTRDRKAPRFRWASGRYNVLNKNLFNQYKVDIENPIQDFSLFNKVIREFNNEIKEAVISNRDGVKLPAFMGVLAVCSYKPTRNPPINWAASEENQVKLKEHNLKTAGLACKLVYSVYSAKYKFRSWALWRFEGNRDFKKRVSEGFIKNYNHYKRMDNKAHVSKMFNENYVTQMPKQQNENIRIDL